jgi:hypothetical protein
MMRALESVRSKASSFIPAPSLRLQRCACGGRCESCRKRNETSLPPIVSEVLRSPGQPLDSRARATLEPRFGHDFSRVRVHADARAAESTRSIAALAFTAGRDVVFGAGQYAPGTAAGQRLLAHELTHVVQQAGSPTAGELTLGQPGDALEREADRMADLTMAPAGGLSPAVTRGPRGIVQRREPGEGDEPQSVEMKGGDQKEAKLRRMAAYPGEALQAWKGLSQADRDSILWQMINRYGADFTTDFLDYAKGKKKPNILVSVTNSPDITPKWLTDQGYRFAANPGGIPQWVHPSGHEYHLLSPPKPAPPDSDDLQKRCGDPCMDSTDDEDSCHKCCDDKIPADDVHCRRNCHATCSTKL